MLKNRVLRNKMLFGYKRVRDFSLAKEYTTRDTLSLCAERERERERRG